MLTFDTINHVIKSYDILTIFFIFEQEEIAVESGLSVLRHQLHGIIKTII